MFSNILFGVLISVVILHIYLTFIKTSKSGTFTLKSDGKTNTKFKGIEPETSWDQGTISSEDENQLPDQIDMSDITGIRLTGSDDLQIFDDHIQVSEDAVIELKKSTLYIKSKSNNISIVNGVVTGNMTGGNSIYINGNLSSVSNVTTIGSSKTTNIPLINFNTMQLDRVSISGSGDIDIHNLRCNIDTDIMINGSGDIKVYNCHFINLVVDIKGSGNVWLNKDCKADTLDLSISGSGDITSKIPQVSKINKSVRGSGDINCASKPSKRKIYDS